MNRYFQFKYFVVMMFLAAALTGCSTASHPKAVANSVRIQGVKGDWYLTVNGKRFDIKGAGVGRRQSRDGAVDYLSMAVDLGANTVRTWGTVQGDRQYLDTAHAYGLYVDAGVWLNPVRKGYHGSYRDKSYCAKVRRRTLKYIKEFKDHPAVILWNIGNETIYWTESETERVAFARFLESLIQDIHAIDPDHPVVYATSFTTAVPYIKKYVPSLDILGVNVYGGIKSAHEKIIDSLDIPYLITEYGPPGNWDQPKDRFGKPVEPTDESQVYFYKRYTKEIEMLKGYCLGAFVFHLGETTQVSATWWNINYKQFKKPSFWAVKEMLTGIKSEHPLPSIRSLVLSKTVGLRPGEQFSIMPKLAREHDGVIHFKYFYSTSSDEVGLVEFPNDELPLDVRTGGAETFINAPEKPGLYRVYVLAHDDHGNASTLNRVIEVVNP
ncbi:MAG TPA: glycoside hydrolase family 2 TIM barrel-domain containing protein [Candidatus Omnitrophota bacterium]|nr:glycoside hydrolase family 2 TIM barrel-domain containing protein [Candidatus Omnitrophota bacterium]